MNVRAIIAMAGAGLLLLMGAALAQGPPRRARLEVMVARSGLGTPVVGAHVTLTTIFGAPVETGMTDGKGMFSFASLNPGEYRLQVQADGYVPQQYGQRYAGGPTAPLMVADSQDKTYVAVSLTPMGSISGLLRDARQQPLPNVSVEVLRPTYDNSGQKYLQVMATARTDDRGEYRTFWVPPGRYILRAGAPPDPVLAAAGIAGGIDGGIDGPNPNEVPIEVAAAYYPDAPNPDSARAIEVRPGADLTAIDWRLPPQPSFHRIRVRVVEAATGRPPAAAEVAILPVMPGFALNPATFVSTQFYNPATGLMAFRDLLPGAYAITAVMRDSLAGSRGQQEPRPLMGSAIVTVANTNVEDVVVTIAPSGSLAGRIRVEGETPNASAPGIGQTLSVLLIAVNRVVPPNLDDGAAVWAAASPEGSFRLPNLRPGEYRLQVSLPANAYLKSAQLAGVDVLNAPLVVAGPVAGTLDIVVGAHGGQVQGKLIDDRSEPIPLAQVVLVPDRARGRPDLYKTATTDGSGRFTLTGVAPGDYKVFSWQSSEPYSWFDPEIVTLSEARASPVHVAESSNTSVDVQLISSGSAR